MDLNYNLSRLEDWLVEIKARVPAEDVQKRFDEALKEARAKARIPGFRKGKAPIELVKVRYEKAVEADVFEDVIKETFRQVIAKEGLKIVELGEIREQDWQPENGLEFKIRVQVEPEIELKNYKKLRAVKEVQQVTEDEVETALVELQERDATVRTVGGEAQKGHFVLADFQELNEERLPIIGHKWEDRYVQIGSGDFGEEFDEQMVGIKKNEERQVTVFFNERQASQEPQFFRVKVKRIEEKNIPEINDEWASEISDHKNVKELRKAIREHLEHESQRNAEGKMHQCLIDELIRNNPFDVPPKMIENYLDYYVEDLRKNLGRPFREREVREEQRPEAIRALKWYLLKKKIVEMENFMVNDDETEQLLEEIAKTRNLPIEKVRQYYRHGDRLDALKEEILENKIFAFLLKFAHVEEIKLSGRKPELVVE